MDQIKAVYISQKLFFETHQTKDLNYRIQALEDLYEALKINESRIGEALKLDLNKSEFDTYATEIGLVLSEIRFTLKHIRLWTKPQKVRTAITHIGTKGYRYPEPYGCTLIIAPWNYPFHLAILPLVGAIAAGNCAIIKPSELTPNVSRLIHEIINAIFDRRYIAVIEGGIEVSEALLSCPFDYIFFTGSPEVGKVVMRAAAEHLIPVTLELGGKSPCIVDKSANLKIAAQRIAWAKFLNAGQTCIAPDYLLIQEEVKEVFLALFKESLKVLYTENPLRNENYTIIVSKKHFDRLLSFIDQEKLIFGGKSDESTLRIEPTILDKVDMSDEVMQEEIFGPIIPILAFKSIHEVEEVIKHSPNPLALYLFSEDINVQREILAKIPSGGACVNDAIYHTASAYLPFGGRGNSGMGAYHGKATFDTFTHYKSVLKQTTLFDIPIRYPNFKNGLKYLKMLMK